VIASPPPLRFALLHWATMTGRSLRDLDLSILDPDRRAEALQIITELEGKIGIADAPAAELFRRRA
jgi:hypothetical protein